MSIFSNFSKEKKLWEWFKNYSARFKSEDLDDQIYSELHDRLTDIHSSLVFEMSVKNKNTRTLVISCDGIKEGIPSVKKVVSSAPHIDGWNVVAFRQPIKESVTLEADKIKLSTDDIKFDFNEAPNDTIDVMIYIDGVNNKNKDDYLRASFVLIDAAIGEYQAMTKIRHLDLLPLPTDTKSLLPLSKLKGVIN